MSEDESIRRLDQQLKQQLERGAVARPPPPRARQQQLQQLQQLHFLLGAVEHAHCDNTHVQAPVVDWTYKVLTIKS